MRTWEAWEQRFAVVRVDAQFESTFAIGRVARIMLRVNRGFGVNGFLISTQGLRGTFDALIGAIEGHFARASGGG
ncbi:MAG: hypothetical protein HY056_14575 [Proteobacteria bacterium]|nr:hypothetical protein [Pseudomonadota bacterium]